MRNVICFVNFKGGVGKTTIAINVAAALARPPHNKNILLIDMDAQANASIWAMGPKAWQQHVMKQSQNSVFQILHDKKYHTNAFKFDHSVVKNPFPGGLAPHMDLLPSTYKMIDAEDILWRLGPDIPVQRIFLEALEPYLPRYDLVIIDCPPNTYRVTQNAISMSRYIFVPCVPDFLSLIGLKELVSRLEDLGGKLGAMHGRLIPIRGILINRFREGLIAANAGMAELRWAVNSLKNSGALLPRCEIMAPKIKDTTAFAQAAEKQVPIFAIGSAIAAEAKQQIEELSKAILDAAMEN